MRALTLAFLSAFLLLQSAALAQSDARRDFIAALVAATSAQRDVQSAEAEFAAARQARTQLEASQRATIAAETAPLAARVEALRARPPIQPSTEASAALVARVDALRARPDVQPVAVARPARLDRVEDELRAIDARRNAFEQDKRTRALTLANAERELQRTGSVASQSARDLDRTRTKLAEARAFLDRLARPDAELQAMIDEEARPRARRALEGDARDALVSAVQRLRNSAATIRASETERGGAAFSNVPAGRAVLVGGGFLDLATAALEGAEKVSLPLLTIAKSGDYMLSRGERVGLADMERGGSQLQASAGGDFDACLLRGLAGTSGDVAARAVIGACRSMHPASARHDVVLRFEELRWQDEVYLFTGPAIAELAEALRRFVATGARLLREQGAAILAEAREDAVKEVAGLEGQVGAAEQRLGQEREAAGVARSRLEALRAADDAAARMFDDFLAASGEAGLRSELATLVATRQAEEKTALEAASNENARQAAELTQAQSELDAALEAERRAAAAANARQADELAMAQRALAQAVDARRQSDAQRMRPLVEREAEAQQRLSRATSAATTAAGAAVAGKRSAYLAELGRNGVAAQFKASLTLDQSTVPQMCLNFRNEGRFAIAQPDVEFLFRGRSLRELGIDPKELFLQLSRFGENVTVYRNRYNESVSGLQPGQTFQGRNSIYGCFFVMRTDGDYGRIFERVGGSVTSWRDQSNWSVRVSGQLSLPDDVQEWREPYSSTRRWRHVATPPERLFAAEIAAAEAEARAQIERGAVARSEGNSALASAPPPAVPAQATAAAVAAPSAPDPARAEASLGLDPARIREIQRRLTALGHDTRGADGVMGPGTRGAISAFQRARKLPETGFLGANELQALGVAR